MRLSANFCFRLTFFEHLQYDVLQKVTNELFNRLVYTLLINL